MISLLLLALPIPLHAVDSPLSSIALPLQDQEPSTEKPKKRKLPKLRGTAKRTTADALLTIRRAKKPDDVKAAADKLKGVGEAATLELFRAFERIEAEDRRAVLNEVLDAVLPDKDLDLAQAAAGAKAIQPIRHYLSRRWRKTAREDAGKFLRDWVADTDPDVAYQAAIGLLRRADEAGLAPFLAEVEARWPKRSKDYRGDLDGIERGPFSMSLTAAFHRGSDANQLAALRAFELLGHPDHVFALKRKLDSSEPRTREAAVNACRVVIDGDPPLLNPTVFDLVQLAEAWKARL